ncbi:response regulator [Pelagicoccus sp. NFK12]|uniref:histidine kinase n=1 Tax=Pelagicoccus enzymogenes TaxID=2773457 RepID=A0A927FDY8_9BACT|nr:response regulator [Pelagicoccus enzymogenes]MBD5782031.1 response regulator [Pelagicoccus enzymogenes]
MLKRSPLDRSVSFRNQLPRVERGWLAGQLSKLPGIATALCDCDGVDDLMRASVVLGRERLGFVRMGIWLLDDDGACATGTFGVDMEGKVIDERGERIFDNSGYIRDMMEAWRRSPHYFEKPIDSLRAADSAVVGRGVRITVPLMAKAEIFGFISVDDLIDTESVNDRAGPLLCQFAQVVSSAYQMRKMQDELERSRQQVSEAERVQSEFLGMMGHEVRTPLNAMMGYAQLLKSRAVGGEIEGIAQTIEESGRHMKGLIDSVLEYSHLSSGDVKRWYKPGDPLDVLRSTVQSFEEMYRGKGLVLDFCFEGRHVPVHFDAVSLRQVVSNLLQNAFKFTERGGAQVRVFSRIEPDATEFFIEVKDTGIGIEEAHQRKIFEPFRQVSGERGRNLGGIGMGLAIVKRLVVAMDGEIACRSVLNEGTVFTIDLKFDNVTEADPSGPGDVPIRDRASSRVLIVDDDETNLEVLQSMAKCLGFVNTDHARNGLEARDLLAEHPYDIVLLDVQMPRMDGLSLTRIVRSGEVCPINREVPIVGVTAYTSKHDREECLMVGMNDYLPKPVMLDSLRRVLDLA